MNREQIAETLRQNQVVAYPTEAVFGLGCNPQSESAVKKLLDLKQRPVEKGLILVAPSLDFFRPLYPIDDWWEALSGYTLRIRRSYQVV